MVKPKPLDQVRYAIRVRHLSHRTGVIQDCWLSEHSKIPPNPPLEKGDLGGFLPTVVNHTPTEPSKLTCIGSR